MVDPHGGITRQTSQAEPITKQKFRNIRRDRHKRDASIRQAQHQHQHDRIETCGWTAMHARASKGSLLLQLTPREVKGCLVRIVIADLRCGLTLCRRNIPLGAFHSPDAIFANKQQLL